MKFFNKKIDFNTLSVKIIIGLIVLLISMGMFFSLVTAILVSKTSSENFCGSCHSMKPMVAAYQLSPHGGNNRVGVKATCVECHLPHDGIINYLYTKTKLGVHDTFAEIFYDKSKIDWEKKRERRGEFTYDSGCLNCHKNLVDATKSNRKAFIAHRSYFNEKEPSCASCHQNVGHVNLKYFLENK